VAIESWFDLTGDSPAGAGVTVWGQNGRLIVEGKLDEKGLFVFTYPPGEALHVVVVAAGGHRKELEIPAAELMQGNGPSAQVDQASAASSPSANPSPEPFADRTTRITLKDVLLGLAVLFAAAGFGLALTTARKLRELRRKVECPEANHAPLASRER
jgi:hypothetical protein